MGRSGIVHTGLYLVLVYLPDERVDITRLEAAQIMDFQSGAHVVYVFHAMPMTAGQKRQFRKLKGRR